ncbi:MAG: PilZ domain-containing protein [Deltaproteobacteria bacterium]|nr:PilZ domain-containing protein [Deltaproteobacteria bacterium]
MMQGREREQVLVLGPEERSRTLASRLSLLGACRGVCAETLESALRVQAASPRAFPTGFVASDHGLPDLDDSLRALGAHGPGGSMHWVAFGPRPAPDALVGLRRAGVTFALFEPASDEELRFVLNQALHRDGTAIPRAEQRVPADLPARIVTKHGEKVALIYNLSATGAYVATPRPTLRGGAVQLLFSLPGGEVVLGAQVMWNNVPGNLRRFNAPIGMGLRFTAVPADLQEELLCWVEQRARAYRL